MVCYPTDYEIMETFLEKKNEAICEGCCPTNEI